jgi:hypothetical protein
MGLLHKVASKSIPELDDVGKVLRDRVLRLAQKGISPYTALSLLKAYGSFQIGICLSLTQDQYRGYASVGLGIEKTNIPLERISTLLMEGAQRGSGTSSRRTYYKIEDPEFFSIKAIDSQSDTWIFPLDDKEPCRSILLLVTERESPFNPHIIARLLSDIRKVLIHKEVQEVLESMPPKQENTIPPLKQEGAMQGIIIDKTIIAQEVKNTIIKYQKINPLFQGILLEVPPHFEEGKKNYFSVQVSQMVSSFGSAIPVSSAHILILFQKSLDRELIAHRLSKSLVSTTILDFEADNSEGVFALIAPYW